jgi:hypothetical protein
LSLKTNEDSLLKQVLLGKISSPTLFVEGGLTGAYVTTWNGRPKLGIGIGGIKYNVKVGDSCYGWAETEYLESGVSLLGVDESNGGTAYQMKETAYAFVKYCCVGNRAIIVSGDGKGLEGVVTGKGGTGASGKHVYVYFKTQDLDKLNIGDKARVNSFGVGLIITGFEGRILNIDPSILRGLQARLDGHVLEVPVVKEIPVKLLGMGVGGSPPEQGTWCIQSNPPRIVEKYGLGNLRIGDLVALRDASMYYGKGYRRDAITVGIVTSGACEMAGHGPQVMAVAASESGAIKPWIDENANISHLLEA